MGKMRITKEEMLAYRKTPNGRRKYMWMYAGVLMDLMSTLGVGIIIINSSKFTKPIYFYISLYILLVLVVLGGELIGVYFGAREQYFYDKQERKEINYDE